ncbi:MAG: DUF1338 domain-containing protein [Pseudomonadota bacterium]|nr:DUF1338 domain-containing protein [Pseudomonadota bacterium]
MNDSGVLKNLIDILWVRYKKRVPYAAQYQAMVEDRGGHVQNDHMAFRTFQCHTGAQPSGIEAIGRVFTALGYERKDQYLFADKKLTAWHYEHATQPENPKLFISQLEVDQLPQPTAQLIAKVVGQAPDLVRPEDMEKLRGLSSGRGISPQDAAGLAERLAGFFTRPWQPPTRLQVEIADRVSQYAAWTLLHGNSVNHFTAYINEQKVREWPDIEATAAALRQAGLPMKDEFEGERGTKLRQTSTKAVMEDCDVSVEQGGTAKLNWSYAYYELAERGQVPDAQGKLVRFQGFLGAQATNLFEMTKT